MKRAIHLILLVVSWNHKDVAEGFSRLDLDRVPNTPTRDGTAAGDFRETGYVDNKTRRGFPRTPAKECALITFREYKPFLSLFVIAPDLWDIKHI
jgi:hypothetical protein